MWPLSVFFNVTFQKNMEPHNFYKTSNHVYVEDDGQVYVMKIGKNSKWNNIEDEHVINITDSDESSGNDVEEIPLMQNIETQTDTFPPQINESSEEEIHPFQHRSIIYSSDDSETMYTSENEIEEEDSMSSFIVSDEYTSSLEE